MGVFHVFQIVQMLPNRTAHNNFKFVQFKFSNVAEGVIIKLLKGMNIDQAACIDNLSEKVLKD